MDFKLAKNSTHELWSCKKNLIRTTHVNTMGQTFNYITSMYTAGRTQQLNGLSSMEKH